MFAIDFIRDLWTSYSMILVGLVIVTAAAIFTPRVAK